MKSLGHYIAGKWTQSNSSEPLRAVDSIYGLNIWQGQTVTDAELNTAVLAAKSTFNEWSALRTSERHQKISLLVKELALNHASLNLLIAQESGRPIWLVDEAINGLVYHLSSLPIKNYRPIGTIAVCGSAISLNYLAQIFELLLYGNSVMLYSLPGSYAVSEKLMQCLEKLDLPKAGLQLVHGTREGAIALAKHPEIHGIVFEGDAATAAMIRLESAQQFNKYLALSVPSNNPLLIKNISNIETAVYQTVRSAFLNSGQEAYAAKSLIIANEPESDHILECLIAMTRSLRIAAYDASPEPFMSSMASPLAAQHALSIQNHLQRQGCTMLLPMKLIQGGTGLLSAGIMLLPAKTEAALCPGPLIQVIRATSTEQCIELARPYPSMAAGIITENEDLFKQYSACCRAEQLYHNMPMQNPGRFQTISYPSAQTLNGNLNFSQPLPGIKLNLASSV
ncbi:MAG: astD [Gammaproteobacteria bacterium]|jgi:succinylglutamic semialdehyde dehydrogenase|nr:astD [Gammaproteobacteria bacterium]